MSCVTASAGVCEHVYLIVYGLMPCCYACSFVPPNYVTAS